MFSRPAQETKDNFLPSSGSRTEIEKLRYKKLNRKSQWKDGQTNRDDKISSCLSIEIPSLGRDA